MSVQGFLEYSSACFDFVQKPHMMKMPTSKGDHEHNNTNDNAPFCGGRESQMALTRGSFMDPGNKGPPLHQGERLWPARSRPLSCLGLLPSCELLRKEERDCRDFSRVFNG